MPQLKGNEPILGLNMVYGIEVVFPSQLALHVEKYLQYQQGEPDDMIRRMHQLVEVQHTREKLFNKLCHK